MRISPTNDLIREILGDKHPIVLGWRVLVETYSFGDNFVNDDGSTSVFERPDSSKDRDWSQMGLGRVLMMGNSTFKGPKFDFWGGIFPQVGDYVSFEKYEGVFKTRSGKNLQYLHDYQIIDIEPEPTKCSYIKFIGN